MNIVIPMAGLGQRFIAAGSLVPKPMIKVADRPMYAWAVESLPLDKACQIIFVLLRVQPQVKELENDIRDRYRQFSPKILFVEAPTKGQAETVLRVRVEINSNTPLLIHNADTAFIADSEWSSHALSCNAGGALVVFRSDEKRWSYSREGPDGWVVEVREKRVISPWASTGTYWFRKGSDFVRLAERRMEEKRLESGEFYIAPLYNDLIAEGQMVKNYEARKILCFGTPEDLNASLPRLRGWGYEK
jgi:NDP-sugar pyrophosphorylase family protein